MTAFADPGQAPTRWVGASDAKVLSALADRDEEALRELHRRYARVIYMLAYKAGTASPEADVQQVFLAMVRHAEQHQRSSLNARLWILGTAYQTLFIPPGA